MLVFCMQNLPKVPILLLHIFNKHNYEKEGLLQQNASTTSAIVEKKEKKPARETIKRAHCTEKESRPLLF